MRFSSKVTGAALGVLALVAIAVWTAVYQADTRGRLSVSVLDTGKSSVVFLRAPSGTTVLIDGGADANALRVLSSALPWWQRSLDVLIVAHTDPAHVGGIPDILQRYEAPEIFVSDAAGAGPSWAAFESALADAQNRGSKVVAAKRGQIVQLGGGAFIELLFPDRDLSGAQTSAGCVAMQLVYGKTSFMFPCGNAAIDDYLVRLDGKQLHSDVLVAPDATTSPLFAGFVGASAIAQKGETFVSDGQTVSIQK